MDIGLKMTPHYRAYTGAVIAKLRIKIGKMDGLPAVN
jgi:hypothetical protein